MKKGMLFVSLIFGLVIFAQDIYNTKDIKPDSSYDNIHVKKIADDSLQTSFVIWVKESVRPHKHAHHTENIYVLEGKGEMTVGDEKFVIKKGDYFSIPKNTPHALKVLSSKPIKVLSIQSPKFAGKDRIFLDEQ
ncbi:cupin domain-containing protein [Paracrocinitomix mangrovi]|uniref:cupin domain-containing protein n=1 Tax=Paracrocinitomix mangrovi TaxID=2862509 RepID=UPI001C8CF5C1|nr:cupin domain-containing protein [Paracrocinitomix mangrovi]UKN02639.1 cupin domain-containing protein [Paracrocinitomix mangrovi]